jgi:ABC-type molybdate transport system substrate-binding protein
LQFARFLAAPERGGKDFTALGYTMLAGDVWKPKQEILIYSGAVNRPALEPLLKAFSDREGVVINTVYNGCGVLCASLKTIAERGGNQLPDAYFACDLCFVPPVAEMFPQVNVLTETKIVIAVLKGNPKGIKGLSDLAQSGIKLGLCNQQQSTLGFMTSGLLKTSGLETAIRKNLAVEVPTADFLINQLRAGGLDAAIVYLVNVLPQQEHLESIELPMAEARAAQPFAVRQGSEQAQTASRLLAFLQGHQKDFEQAGFVWRGNEAALESKKIAIPDWLKK